MLDRNTLTKVAEPAKAEKLLTSADHHRLLAVPHGPRRSLRHHADGSRMACLPWPWAMTGS